MGECESGGVPRLVEEAMMQKKYSPITLHQNGKLSSKKGGDKLKENSTHTI